MHTIFVILMMKTNGPISLKVVPHSFALILLSVIWDMYVLLIFLILFILVSVYVLLMFFLFQDYCLSSLRLRSFSDTNGPLKP